MKRSKQVTLEKAKDIFRQAGGVMRTRQALAKGINPRTLYAMRDSGILEVLSRGVYRLGEVSLHGSDDLISVAHRVEKGRICLISALAHYELTTQIPHFVYCAIPRNASIPKIDYPPVKFFRFCPAVYDAGVEYHDMSGVRVAIYDPEKTLVDCFKYRNRIVGMDTMVEALRFYRENMTLRVDALMNYARICRVEKAITPYLEAIL
jgi:predicted transcriptional regulator of viral defense system